jgi:hypothetical protein
MDNYSSYCYVAKDPYGKYYQEGQPWKAENIICVGTDKYWGWIGTGETNDADGWEKTVKKNGVWQGLNSRGLHEKFIGLTGPASDEHGIPVPGPFQFLDVPVVAERFFDFEKGLDA